jgi:PAS domain S-box-containing protein
MGYSNGIELNDQFLMNLTPGSSFFEAQPMFICEQVSLKILDVNTAAINILESQRDELLGKRIIDIAVQKEFNELNLNVKSNNHFSINKVWVFPGKSGDDIHFQFSAHLINYKGTPAKLVIGHNVSGILRKEESGKDLLSSQLNLNNFPLAEIEWDPYLNIIRWSQKAEELFGYSQKEAMNKPYLLKKFIHPDDFDCVYQAMKETYENGGKEVSLICRHFKKNGDLIYCEWYNSFLYNDRGEVVAIYSLTHDVSDREEALTGAKRSMLSYQDLFNSISDAIYLINKKGIILEANTGLESTFGYSRKEVVGSHFKLLSAPGKYDEERIKEINKKASEKNSIKYEGWGRKKNGEVFPTEFLVNSGSYFGEDVLIVIERDISSRRESEEALRHREGLFSKLFNSSPLGIALLNEHREVEMVNDGFEQLFGYREHELKGLELDKVIVPEKDHDLAVQLSESEQVKEATEKRIRKDGTIIDVIIYAVPVVVDKSILGIYGIYVDITDRKKAEEDVRKSLHEKEMLLAEVHHRVKNNLAVITGLLELQSYSADNESARQILKESQARVNSIAMVHEKLYKSDDFSQVDVKQYLEELSLMIHKMMDPANLDVAIELNMEHVELPIIQAIPCGLLFNEVITNSFKHAFKGRKTGEIKVCLIQRENEINLRIEDDGVGLPEIAENDIQKSMGMTLIKTLAKQLGAEYSFRNNPGAILEFKFQKKEQLD